MLSKRLLDATRVTRLERRAGVSDSAVALTLVARFTDELLSGILYVLAPTFRRVFGLDLVAVSLLDQVLFWVALVIEPPAALMIDVRPRRFLLAWGALWISIALLLVGVAPTYAVLLAGFAAYGLGSGPLAHSADVVLVESFSSNPERIFARATMLDTVGALLAPALVAGVAFTGITWRALPIVAALGGLVYARNLARTDFPPPHPEDDGQRGFRKVVANVRAVLADPVARGWLLALFWLHVYEAPHALRLIWLNDEVGMSQGVVALYVAGEYALGLGALVALDRWTARGGSVLVTVAAATIVLHTAWVLAPGIAGRIAVGIPLAFTQAMLWPVLRSRALASSPGRGGTVTAVTTVFGVVPLTLLFGLLAEAIGLTEALLAVPLAAGVLLLVTARALD